MRDQIKSLQSTDQTEVKTETKKVKAPEFDLLSESDFKTLAEDNPAEALIYTQKYNEFQTALSTFNSEQQTLKDSQKQSEVDNAQVEVILSEATTAMEKVIPGLFDEDGKIQAELIEYADSVGFTTDMFYLTNPATQIILPGQSEPLLLGDQAASILQVLVNTRKNTAPPVDKAELEAEIRKTIEVELLAKFKSEGIESFKSLSQIPKTETETEFGDKILTDTQFNKLSDIEQEAYLSGA